MTTIFASDIHGNQIMINKIRLAQKDFPMATLVFGGDYIDGQDSSKQVLNFIEEQQIKHPNQTISLLGNHEDLLRQFVKYDNHDWFLNGAKKTIKSLFGRNFSKKQDRIHLNHYLINDRTNLISFIDNLKLYYYNQDGFFIHAYIDLTQDDITKAINNTKIDDMIWNRNFVINNKWSVNKTNYHIFSGHTPTVLLKNVKLNKNYTGQITKFVNTSNNDSPVIQINYDNHKKLTLCD